MVVTSLQRQTDSDKRDRGDGGELSSITDAQLEALFKCVKREIQCRALRKRRAEERALMEITDDQRRKRYFIKRAESKLERKRPKSLRPEHYQYGFQGQLRYLIPLLYQDWSYLWPDGDPAKRYCVYAHVDRFEAW